jgi:hypothetical protein
MPMFLPLVSVVMNRLRAKNARHQKHMGMCVKNVDLSNQDPAQQQNMFVIQRLEMVIMEEMVQRDFALILPIVLDYCEASHY